MLESNEANIHLKKKIYKKTTGLDYDTRTKKEVFKELRKTNKNVSISTHSLVDPISGLFSLSGKSFSKTIMCSENGYYSIYDSDRYGLNNPDYEWKNKFHDILVIGDSFALGSCVNRPNDVASVIRNNTKRSVISLGLRAHGPLRELASLKEFSSEKVKNIIWMYFEGNDLEGLGGEKKNKTLIKYLTNRKFSQNLKEKQDLVDKIVEKHIKERSNIFFDIKRFLKLGQIRNLILNYKKTQEDNFEDFRKVISELIIFSEKKGARIYFVYLPEYKRYSEQKYDNSNYEKIKKLILEENLVFIDIHSKIFKNEKDPLLMFSFGLEFNHYTVEAYKKISNLIILNLQK